MKKIPTILVDDEVNSNVIMQHLLEKNAPQVEVVATAQNVKSAIEAIDKHKPDLVFMDISMPDGDGFEVLDKVEFKNFQVIFVTAYNQYAIRAFEVAALHYLLKPVVAEDLVAAIKRYETNKEENNSEKLKVFSQALNAKPQRLILPTSNGVHIVDIEDIIRCESSNNYTTFFLKESPKIVVSKSIHIYEQMLSDLYFCRVHNKHLVNLKFVKRYIKGRGGSIVLNDGTQIDVSDGRKNELIARLKELSL